VNSAKGEPGKKARTQAAGIAAWFSKLKGSKLVPVAMTQRKYVRKPKGAPPGTVVIEREEVIITAPALPEK
jgi:predicted ribosome quality control (RQC) complex YloA/Tae2 family protein